MKNPSQTPDLPEGTVTFLFTDIEGSTKLLEKLGDQYASLLAEHRRILSEIFTRWHGQEVDTQGDSCFFTFPCASDAVSAVVEAQKAFAKNEWPEKVEVRVRMGLHTGESLVTESGYVGMDVHRAARIGTLGHGGQVLLSEATVGLIRNELPEAVSLLDLGKHRLKDIIHPERIHQLVVEGLPSKFPPLASPEIRPNNLPLQPTPFVGRRDELEDLDALIADPDNRIISILGAGGMGKTRLAIAAAEQQLDTLTPANGKEEPRFPDGAFFVRLAPLERTEDIIPTIGKAIGFQFYEGVDPKKQILDYFRQKRMLLLMDNFEHLKEGASILTELVQASHEVKILVTSREKLNLRSEVIYLLKGMRYPEESEIRLTDEPFSAVDLFLQSTRRFYKDFVPNGDELKSIGRICRLVEGMPLGVELAAAWMEMLSPDEIASEIQESLDFLEVERLDAPARHQSIRAVFDSTWKHSSEEEREILKKVSVFRGGFTAEAGREVAGASFKQLLGLVNKSLLQRSSTQRLAIHELLRQYAAEKLEQNPADKEAVHDLHCEYFADFLHQREATIDGGDQAQALEEMDNLRASWQWAVRREKIPEIRKQLHSLVYLLDFQGWYMEGERILGNAAEALRTEVPEGEKGSMYGRLLAELGFFKYRCGNEKEGLKLIRESQSLLRGLGAKSDLAIANYLFAFLYGSENYLEAKEYLLESIEIFAEKKISWEMAHFLNTMGNIISSQGNYLEAEDYYCKALKIGEALNNRRSIAWSYSGLATVVWYRREDYEKAREYLEKGSNLFQSIGYKYIAGMAINNLGSLFRLIGKYEEAKERHLTALAINKEIGKRDGIGSSIINLGHIDFEIGEFEKAKEKYEEALTIFENLEEDTSSSIGFLMFHLGNVAVAMREDCDAGDKFQKALTIGIDIQNKPLCLAVVGRMSSLLARNAQIGHAIEVSALVASHPESWDYFRDHAKKDLVNLEELTSLKEFRIAKKRGQERDVWETAEEMLAWLEGLDQESAAENEGR